MHGETLMCVLVVLGQKGLLNGEPLGPATPLS